MSQLAWFPFYVNDYLGDTSRLSYGQHGIYLLLLAEYWRGGPIEDDLDLMCRICAGAPPEMVRSILERFWVRTDLGWTQTRMEKIKSDQMLKHERRVNAGRLGGASKSRRLSNASSNAHSNSELRISELQNTDTENSEEKYNARAQARRDLDFSPWPSMPTPQVFKDWKSMRSRMRAPVTQTVINRLAKQFKLAEHNGFTVDDCLGECLVRGWRGFEADWMKSPKGGKNGNKHLTFDEMRRQNTHMAGEEWLASEGVTQAGEVIEHD